MNKVASSFSLSAYDFLAVLIPGGIILSSIIYNPYFKNPIEISTEKSNGSPEWLRYTLLFIVAYLLGLIWKMFMDWIFKFLRNNPDHIKIYYKPNNSGGDPQQENNEILDRYYLDYYFLQRENALGQILILERQFAFVRNILFLIPLLANLLRDIYFSPRNFFSHFLCFIFFLLCFAISCFLLKWMKKTQSKIYGLVSEGAYYYDKLTKDQTKRQIVSEPKEEIKDDEFCTIMGISVLSFLFVFFVPSISACFFLFFLLLLVACEILDKKGRKEATEEAEAIRKGSNGKEKDDKKEITGKKKMIEGSEEKSITG